MFVSDLHHKGDHDTAEVAKLERSECMQEAHDLEETLLEKLLPTERADDFDIILEVSISIGIE